MDEDLEGHQINEFDKYSSRGPVLLLSKTLIFEQLMQKTLEYYLAQLVPFSSDLRYDYFRYQSQPHIDILILPDYGIGIPVRDGSYLCHLSANVPLRIGQTYWLTSP
jgi:hypothetical protein